MMLLVKGLKIFQAQSSQYQKPADIKKDSRQTQIKTFANYKIID